MRALAAVVVVEDPVGQRAGSFHLLPQVKCAQLYGLVLDNGYATLFALVHISQRVVESRASHAGKGGGHFHVGEGKRADKAIERPVVCRQAILFGYAHFIEENFTLGQGALAQLVQGLATGNTGQV